MGRRGQERRNLARAGKCHRVDLVRVLHDPADGVPYLDREVVRAEPVQRDPLTRIAHHRGRVDRALGSLRRRRACGGAELRPRARREPVRDRLRHERRVLCLRLWMRLPAGCTITVATCAGCSRHWYV